MEGFKVEIVGCSKELSARERIQLKDTTDMTKIDTVTQEKGSIIITPVMYAELAVHNEHSKEDNKDYRNYVIVDKSGERFVTGSESFYSAFINIVDEMEGEEEEYAIRVYRMPSKNRAGKEFITCSIV